MRLDKNTQSNIKINFFIYIFYSTLTAKIDGNAFVKKKLPFCYLLESFVDKITFNLNSFKKINDFTSHRYTTTIFYI